MDIAAAKEVLTDEGRLLLVNEAHSEIAHKIETFAEMREKYDRGEDPLDPEQKNGGPFNGGPFPFHGHPFGGGGGPFQFKFHFN